jgi:Protein kinase domain
MRCPCCPRIAVGRKRPLSGSALENKIPRMETPGLMDEHVYAIDRALAGIPGNDRRMVHRVMGNQVDPPWAAAWSRANQLDSGPPRYRTTIACACPLNHKCRGAKCAEPACAVHRESRILARLAGVHCVCTPIFLQSYTLGVVLVLPRHPQDMFEWIQGLETEPTAQQMRDIATAIHDGIRALHRAGVAHGDIKPENIVLRASGARLEDVRFIDFDQSVVLSEMLDPDPVSRLSRFSKVCREGTAAYADMWALLWADFGGVPSPELMRRILEERDFWQLAMTLCVAYLRAFPSIEPPGQPGRRITYEDTQRPSSWRDGSARISDMVFNMRMDYRLASQGFADEPLTRHIESVVFAGLSTQPDDQRADRLSKALAEWHSEPGFMNS